MKKDNLIIIGATFIERIKSFNDFITGNTYTVQHITVLSMFKGFSSFLCQ